MRQGARVKAVHAARVARGSRQPSVQAAAAGQRRRESVVREGRGPRRLGCHPDEHTTDNCAASPIIVVHFGSSTELARFKNP